AAGALILLLSAVIIFYFRSRAKRVLPPEPVEDPAPVADPATGQPPQSNAVYILGEFTVYDKNGKDITFQFSPKLKQLFILILLYSKGRSEGITSKKISVTLWPDKDVIKTKNIRGVNLNHLRSILSDMQGIELIYHNDTYRFEFSGSFFCDCFAVLDVLKAPLRNEETVMDHFGLIARGPLLYFMPEVWLDDFKEEYAGALLPTLLPIIKTAYDTGAFKRVNEITRVVLNIDPFNDTAIAYKLKAVRRTKGIEHARRLYDDFAAEYRRSLGIAYAMPFEKICSNKEN
ncbi:MAG TPA: hypothetical protein VIM77_03435, partial [Mucilaginibacter sp.]